MALTVCLVAPEPPTSAPPRSAAPPQRIDTLPSDESLALARYYSRVQSDLTNQGLLRQSGGGPDTPFGPRQLSQNFLQVALYDEYDSSGGTLVARKTVSRLRRWEQAISMRVVFGRSVTPEQRSKDRSDVQAFANRLTGHTGLPIILDAPRPNFHVLILNEDERRDYGPRLERIMPGIGSQAVQTIVNMPRSIYCLVFTFAEGNQSSTYTGAVAVIRAEHPDVLRLSCIHEELAQGLGLANDSPQARPSIFNDDDEFALLTEHDELLLQILYDPRLTPGMTEAEARPIVQTIAAELFDTRS